MSEVFKICIANKSGLNMQEKSIIDVIANKGILDDRYFLDSNDKDVQITLIESENIDYYNKISGTNILSEPNNFTASSITTWRSPKSVIMTVSIGGRSSNLENMGTPVYSVIAEDLSTIPLALILNSEMDKNAISVISVSP